MRKHITIRILGLVQGVFFRHEARKRANELGLKGFVRNESDGSLYIEVEGEKDSLGKFLQWCKTGPPSASVKRVEAEVEAMKNYTDFVIE